MRWGRPGAMGILGMGVIQEVDDDEDESQADTKDGERSLAIPSRLATPRPPGKGAGQALAQPHHPSSCWVNRT
jgi:hypothetical protein